MSALERASQHAGIDVPSGPGAGEHGQPLEHERPEDWGWHADLGNLARAGGIISIVVLLIGLSATHYNRAGSLAICLTVAFLVVGLLVDARQRRRTFRR